MSSCTCTLWVISPELMGRPSITSRWRGSFSEKRGRLCWRTKSLSINQKPEAPQSIRVCLKSAVGIYKRALENEVVTIEFILRPRHVTHTPLADYPPLVQGQPP